MIFSVPVSGQLILQNGYSLQPLHLLLHEQGFQAGLHCGHAQVRSQKHFFLFALIFESITPSTRKHYPIAFLSHLSRVKCRIFFPMKRVTFTQPYKLILVSGTRIPRVSRLGLEILSLSAQDSSQFRSQTRVNGFN